MVDVDPEQTAQPMATNMFTKKNDLLSTAMKRTSEWIFSQEIPSDVTVRAGGTSFSLHKAHPALSDMERKKVCSVMNFQKLSREACAHAAQNERLPVQMAVQVLYYEQQHLREVMDSSLNDSPSLRTKENQFSINIHPVSDELSTLRKENQDLKLELVKMTLRLKEIAKSDDPEGSIGSPSGTRLSFEPRKSFISSVSKTLGRFIRVDGIVLQSAKHRNKPSKDRRHSIS
ncbi:BTB POZ domain-containing At5g67385 [Olea europaea subsp. europaea]|uniref:BTB POZ domain-containing At5g67385 n=1 Tax=Olea europaea subsp. europaea TaxID=158383 RepID=A0A8S0PDN2_OLEEU|nr:BTB POZ domain-containing At5g67385 [Olea europaea subsp. europaea]